MGHGLSNLDDALVRLEAQLAGIAAGGAGAAEGAVGAALARLRADSAALRFHLSARSGRAPIAAVLGGTGTGKSTLVNRLLGRDLSAASFKRTFTAGAIAVAANADEVPKGWLGVDHMLLSPEELPARGRADELVLVAFDSELTRKVTLVDTPDLDGDQPAHHAAHRVARRRRGVARPW